MRRAILVLVLVAASFLGGAFVNGPGLRWAETRVLRSLGLNNDGEITSVDLQPAFTSDTGVDELGPGKPGINIPTGPHAPAPSVLMDDKSSQDDALPRSLKSEADQLPRADDSTGRELATKPAMPRLPANQTPLAFDPRGVADSSVKKAGITSGSVESGNVDHPTANAKPDLLDTLVDLLPSNPQSSSSSSSPPTGSSVSLEPTQKPSGAGATAGPCSNAKCKALA